MEVRQVTAFANLLRDSGDKILNSELKLTLSGSLLKGLNDSFLLITQESDTAAANGFQVAKQLSTNSEVLIDLQLIYDFIQKTPSLCIACAPGEENLKEVIDLSKFRSLNKLEIQKICVNQIVGIQKLRSQLKQLICHRCLKNVDDIIVYCGKDNSMGFVWSELRVADFSNNSLTKCDHSLEFTAYLQNLNLSHNLLTSVEAIKWLPHLKILNLSFNRLKAIPIFHIEANRKLQVLIVNNNMIEIVDALKLEALTDFDISNNLLLDHSNLLPLSTFFALNNLNLTGNPLSYHPKHREITSKYLHKNVARKKFILDFQQLNKYEKSLTGKIKSFNPLYSSRSCSQIGRISGSSTPSYRSQLGGDSFSVGSVDSYEFDFKSLENKCETIKKLPKSRIIDLEEPIISVRSTEDNKSHLETKTQIEQLRQHYGARWLQDKNSKEVVENALGLETSAKENKNSIPPDDLIKQLLYNSNTNNTRSLNDTTVTASTPLNKPSFLNIIPESPPEIDDTISDIDLPLDNVTSIETVYESANEISTTNMESNTSYKSAREEPVPKEDIISLTNIHIEEEPVSESEESEEFFVANSNGMKDYIFFSVSDTKIRERNVLTKRTLEKWSIKVLESCDRIKSDTIRLNFDTIKQDKKERLYKIEESRCQYLEKMLREILSNRQLSEMNQTMYRCVQCLCQFSRETPNKYKDPDIVIECPECQSKFVAEVNESPISVSNATVKEVLNFKKSSTSKATETSNVVNCEFPIQTAMTKHSANSLEDKTMSNEANADFQSDKNVLMESASQSSIGSAGSLNKSSSCSKISQNSFDSNQSVAGSSSNERDNDFNNMGIGNSKYYNDSDVEVLSNPSQSSIEVIDSFQSSRKTSEERRISRIPSLETIEDNCMRNFSFKIGDDTTTTDLLSGVGIINDINRTITSKDSTAEFLKESIRQTLAEQEKIDSEKLTEEYGLNKNTRPLGLIEKKMGIGHLNLTESSSSGSVTDSMCTAYEQDHKSNNDLSNTELTEDENKEEKDASIISNIFEGLLQTTSKLISKSQKSIDSDLSSLSNKFKYDYNDFDKIDHRLHFYFTLNKFNIKNESFKWLVKGKIFEGNTLRYYDAIVLMSTVKLYIMEITGPETEDPSKWLKEILNVSSDRMEALQLLPFKAGLSITIRNYSQKFLLILQDILRTDSLMLYFANNPLPNNCSLEYQVSEIVMAKLLVLTNNSKIKMFAILNSCDIEKTDHDVEKISPAGFYITDDYLYMTKSNLSWLSENLLDNIDLSSLQKMRKLEEVKKLDNNTLQIYFADEVIDSHEVWKCEFGTQENSETFLNAIEQSWEKCFGVPLLNI